MNKKINNKEHPYVDLGLPSGTLWATCNVGASKPSDFGLYFQWGDIQGYTAEQVGKENGKKLFEWDDYKWDLYADGKAFSKYTKAGETLNLEDDAAHINMGGEWHIPSPEQIKELLDNTTTEWILLDDEAFGMAFTSKNGKSIFIPAAGWAWWGSIYDIGSYGYIWSSVVDKDHVCDGKYMRDGKLLAFYSEGAYLKSESRDNGYSIRGVIG